MKAFHFDFNTAFYRMDYLEKFIRDLRDWGYDTLLWELEDFVRWETIPAVNECDSISKAEVKKLLDHARSCGMKNIPLLQCLGHCEYVLKHREYSHLADTPGKWSPYCPSKKETGEFLHQLINEYLTIFEDSPVFHLGCDEVWQLGEVCPECKRRIAAGERAKLMAEHINFLAGMIRNAGKRPMIWADMLLIYPEMAAMLDKDIIMADWRYELRNDREKLWLWDEKGGFLTDESGITPEMRQDFGEFLYSGNQLNIHYTTDFLKAQGFEVICAGASSCFPDNFLLGNAANHIHNCCTMMKKGMENLGYLQTSWSVHLFFYELQPAIEMVRPADDRSAVMDEYTEKYFGIKGKEFFDALDLLAPRVLFSGAESTGCGKAVKEAAPGIIRRKLQEFHEAGILTGELAKAYQLRQDFAAAVKKLDSIRQNIRKGEQLFDLYILAAQALLNRAEFAILAASEFLGKTHDIDRQKVKCELLRLSQSYLTEYRKRQTPLHAARMVHTAFGTLLEYLG